MSRVPEISYGISPTSRMVLLIGILFFVLGGSLSVIGVATDEERKWVVGVGLLVLGVAVYTLTIMLAEVTGPPSGFDLQDFETLYKIKPASFHPSRESRFVLILAFLLFSSGSTMVISGFKLSLLYLWIPGYSMAVVAFVIYTAVVLYGPLTVTPGALIVAFPDDTVARPDEEERTASGVSSVQQQRESAYGSAYDDYRGYLGFQKYAYCPRGYTPQNP
ncbi:unnamed protein product, partial [Ixodes hexagonus]